MKKVVRLGKMKPEWTKRSYSVFCEIEFERGRLSIHGVEGPLPSGNARGGCGQIDMHCKVEDIIKFAPGWDKDKLIKFLQVWKEWHLNDLQAGCEHQRAAHWEDERIDPIELPNSHANRDEKGIIATCVQENEHPNGLLCKPCPVCGYKYGTAWLKKEVPQEVIDFLFGLPDTDIHPAWV